MNFDLLAITKSKLDFDDFCIYYFETVKQSSSFFNIHNKEKLILSTASDYYEDYVNSDLNFDNYCEQKNISNS